MLGQTIARCGSAIMSSNCGSWHIQSIKTEGFRLSEANTKRSKARTRKFSGILARPIYVPKQVISKGNAAAVLNTGNLARILAVIDFQIFKKHVVRGLAERVCALAKHYGYEHETAEFYVKQLGQLALDRLLEDSTEDAH